MTKDLYDFSDTSDLQQLVDLVNGAPMALSMAQIIAVATHAGVELPAATTVCGYIV